MRDCPPAAREDRSATTTNSQQRLSGREIARSIAHEVFELELPLLRTAIDLTIRPGSAARAFVDGRRKKYTNPVKYCVFAAAIYALVFVIFDIDVSINISLSTDGSTDALNETIETGAIEFYRQNINWLVLAAVPGLACVTWLVFLKSKLNYIENLVLLLYITAQMTLLNAGLALIGGQSKPIVSMAGSLVGVVYFTWAAVRFYRMPLWATLWRSAVAQLFFVLINFVVALSAILLFVALPAVLARS